MRIAYVSKRFFFLFQLSSEEACAYVSGQKLQGPEAHPMKLDRAPGDVQISDLPIRRLEPTLAKVEQFTDILFQHPVNFDEGLFANMYKLCYEGKYGQLPPPFCLAKSPNYPFTIQFVILPSPAPEDADPNVNYHHIIKHVYLHRNKQNARDCVAMCYGDPMRFEWGNSARHGLAALNHMLDRMGGPPATSLDHQASV